MPSDTRSETSGPPDGSEALDDVKYSRDRWRDLACDRREEVDRLRAALTKIAALEPTEVDEDAIFAEYDKSSVPEDAPAAIGVRQGLRIASRIAQDALKHGQ